MYNNTGQFKNSFRAQIRVFGRRSKVSPALPIAESREWKPYFGAHGEEETPVLIPNTEVKLFSGDYTAQVGN